MTQEVHSQWWVLERLKTGTRTTTGMCTFVATAEREMPVHEEWINK